MSNVLKNNSIAGNRLKKLWESKGIYYCEVCGSSTGLSNAHFHKRIWYRKNPELLYDFNQVLRLCLSCHEKIEYNKAARDYLFKKLRREHVQ